MSDLGQARMGRRNLVIGVVLVLIVGIVAIEGAGTYLLPSQKAPPPVTLVSSVLGVYPQANSTTISGDLWVQNTGDKQIVAMTGSIPGLPTASIHTASFLSSTLYPNEIGSFMVFLQRQGPAPEFASGTNHTLTMVAKFSDGTNATLTANFTASICGGGSAPEFETFAPGDSGVDSSTGQATWQLTTQTNTTLPVFAVAVGVNNGTLWFPFEVYNKPISASNPLNAGTVATETFTWKNQPGSFQVLQWVGACADQNGMSTLKIFGD